MAAEKENVQPSSIEQVLSKLVSDIAGCLPCSTKAKMPVSVLAQRSHPAGVGLIFEVVGGDWLRVHCVLPGSDAGTKGVQVGDYLTEIDNVQVCLCLSE